MAIFISRFMVKVLLLLIYMIVFSDAVQMNRKEIRISEIGNKLKALNKPAVKSIKSSDGDIIDCIDIYKQPAFDHPALKNHTVQTRPSYVPTEVDSNNKNSPTVSQIWQKSGSCPEGTIPIRRVKEQDLLRFGDIERFGRKYPEVSNGLDQRSIVINNATVSLGPQVNRSTAMLVATVTHYVGAKGSLNVWNPHVESPEEYTTSQIWLRNGPPDSFESVESGWTVNPKVYGDTRTRIFAYWTVDSSQKTGCFDLRCAGFVQTSKEVTLGAAIEPISGQWGPQYEIGVQIYLDNKTDNWWLRWNDKVDVGYWPRSLFSSYLRSGATLAEWGGEVYSQNLKKTPHTSTAMGSGEFAEGLYRYASYIAHIRSMDYSYSWVYPRYVGTYADEWNCYTAFHYVPGFMSEPTLYFGGPGKNLRCP